MNTELTHFIPLFVYSSNPIDFVKGKMAIQQRENICNESTICMPMLTQQGIIHSFAYYAEQKVTKDVYDKWETSVKLQLQIIK